MSTVTAVLFALKLAHLGGHSWGMVALSLGIDMILRAVIPMLWIAVGVRK